LIIRVHNKVICIIVPQKSGISTVTNILSYPITKEVTSKSRARRILKRNNALLHVGSTLKAEQIFAKENNIKIDYLYAVIRNPLDRFKSAYKDRIIVKNIDNFPDNSLDYALNNIKNVSTDFGKHARPQTEWLGKDLKVFDKVFDTYKLNSDFKPLIEKLTGVAIPEVKENSTSYANIKVEINEEQREIINNFYKDDYLIFNSL